MVNSNSKINTMIPIYVAKLGLKICHINIKNQKTDGSTFKIFKMVLLNFQIIDKWGRAWYF